MNYKKMVKPYEKDLINTLKYLVSFPSFKDPSTINENTPYGKSVDDALNAFAKIGEMYGFMVEKSKRYVELSYGQSGPIIEIFGHLDVVPVDKSNNRDPFTVTSDKNNLYGRGVADDKGPLLASFYAIKALKDNDLIPDNVQIKIFAGGDEECGGTCLEDYLTNHPAPTFGFTPDSAFPLVYGEKGIGNILLKKSIKLKHIVMIKGGNAANTVIGKAIFKVDNINEIKSQIKTPHEINNDEITFIGLAAHGSRPELGKNAFLLGLLELGKINHDDEAIKLAETFLDYNGKKLNAYAHGEHLLDTTYNVGVVDYQNEIFLLKINFRYPEKVDATELVNQVIKTLDANLVSENHSPCLLHDLKSKLVTSLLDAYYQETNDTSKPVTSGGGTYAKEVKNTIAFGAEFPGDDYKMHEADEYIPIKALNKSMVIYAHAIHNLIKQK